MMYSEVGDLIGSDGSQKRFDGLIFRGKRGVSKV